MDYNLMTMKEDDFDGINDNSNYSSSDTINNNSNQRMNNPSGMSKAELRKSNKPIMEKRRRARINHCLNELKTLILEAMKKDPARHTKLEKADILEMTVKHLQSIQRQQLSLAIQTDPTVIHKFKTGFTECAEEVTRYIAQLEGVDAGVKQRLSNHLNNCSTGLEQLGSFSNFSSSYRTNSNTFGTPLNAPSPMFPLPQDVNNNGRIQMGGVQLIPSRLPSGELALIMPNTSSVPFFLPNMQPQALDFSNTFPRISAFSKPTSNLRSNVSHTATTTSSPPLSPVSSVSSLGDDSLHANLDSQSKTPPLQMSQSFSNAFPTPPSTESVKFISHTGHLQQPHVSSTSECSQLKSDLDDKKISKKRLCPDEVSICDEPASKVLKSEDIQNGNVPDEASNAESTNDMWRPW